MFRMEAYTIAFGTAKSICHAKEFPLSVFGHVIETADIRRVQESRSHKQIQTSVDISTLRMRVVDASISARVLAIPRPMRPRSPRPAPWRDPTVRLIAVSVVSVEAPSPIHAGSTRTASERKAENGRRVELQWVPGSKKCLQTRRLPAIVPHLHLGHQDWLFDCI
jgi:hypothetical protein